MLTDFAKIWICHFSRLVSNREKLFCFTALELNTGQIYECGPAQLENPPVAFDDHALFVFWDAPAEIGFFLACDWPTPVRIINLSVESRLAANGFPAFAGTSLFGALTERGLDSSGAVENAPINLTAIPNENNSTVELDWAVTRCRLAVKATARLFENMAASIDVPLALYRGRFALASAKIERTGIPIDTKTLAVIKAGWETLYPQPTGHRLPNICVDDDGRHRFKVLPFATITGRSQTQGCILEAPAWVRGLIKPSDGSALAYLDWSAEEVGIAAAMSGDENLRAAYLSGDCYMRFAIEAGAAPQGATRFTHPSVRAEFKAVTLSILYGIGQEALARKLNSTSINARDILDRHRNIYPDYWRWSDNIIVTAFLTRSLSTVFGWKLHVVGRPRELMLRNFPVQAAGAEILRLAACLITEAGVRICATLHDAILIESTAQKLSDDIELAQRLMAEASRIVLLDFELRTDVSAARFPKRLYGAGGSAMWNKMMRQLRKTDAVAKSREHWRS